MSATQICEACRAARASLKVEAGAAPFRICEACRKRLHARALRPLEWFNLASLYGPAQYLLRDEFYDDDGRACQPKLAIDKPGRFPMPALRELEGNADRLLDFAITRHFVWEHSQPGLVVALRRLDPLALLARLRDRVANAKDEHVEHVCIVVCGHAVGVLGGSWVEVRYAAPTAPALLSALAFAASRCLAERPGFELAVRALERAKDDLPRRAFGSLGWFQSAWSLDWIEREVQPPLVETWGSLAAVSRPPWARLATWIGSGRPLSLVALDALVAVGTGRAVGFQGGAPMVRWLHPALVDPPTRAVASSVLDAYAARDDTPRARRAVRAVLANWELIAGTATAEWTRVGS